MRINGIQILISLISLLTLSSGFLNLYLTVQEVFQLLGVNAELYFIRNGSANDNALKFLITVPSSKDSLQFTWHNSLSIEPVKYEITIETSGPQKTRLSSILDIDATGMVPISPQQTFSLNFKCTDFMEKKQTNITLNMSLSSRTESNFKLHLMKKCDSLQTDDGSITNKEFTGHKGNFAKLFYSAVLAILIFALLITILALYPYYLNKRSGSIQDVANRHYKNFVGNMPAGSFSGISNNTVLNNRSKDLQERISELTVQRYRVRLGNILLQGAFGRIYEATYVNDNEEEESVIVKTVANHASETQISLLLQEGMSMYSLDHDNILTIVRVSIQDHTAPFLLFPVDNYNNLKVFLHKCKASAESLSFSLTTQEVVDMAFQITDALQYLHKKNLIHRDVAARNCVIRSKLKVQIMDSALSRDLFPGDYHCLGDNENRPVKWLAYETLCHNAFSPSSDIWSFGVLLWELTTLAQQPYIDVDPFEIIAYLKDGYRLSQPINCPDELYALMSYCWTINIEERPTLAQLQLCLQDFSAQLSKYV